MTAPQIQGFRLSPQQRRLWRLQEDSPAAYRAQAVVNLRGAIDRERLREALGAVVERHEILRTSFVRTAGMKYPVQVIGEPDRDPPRLEALEELAEAGSLERLGRGEWERRFDLAQWSPGFRLAARGAQEHALIITLPALCADASSFESLVADLAAYYGGEGANLEAPLQYADYCEWQHQILSDPGAEEGKRYWQRLAACPPPPRLPHEGAATPGSGFAVRVVTACVDGGAQSRAAAAQLGVTPGDFLAACWRALWWRLGGEQSFPITHWSDGRKYEDLAAGCGLYARALPVHLDLAAEESVETIVKRTAATLTEARGLEEYLVWRSDGAATGEGLGEHAGLAVGFESREAVAPRRASGLEFSLASRRIVAERCKLQLVAETRDGGLELQLAYDLRLFPEPAARCFLEAFVTLTAAAARNPCAALEALPILGARERRTVLAAAAAGTALPAAASLPVAIGEQARRRPEAVALAQEGRHVSYGELARHTTRLRRRLTALGIAPEDSVGVALERSPEAVAAVLAILEAGGVYVVFDPGAPAARSQLLVERARPAIVVSREGLRSRLAGWGVKRLLTIDGVRDDTADETEPPLELDPRRLAYISFTSGSTGVPKGVLGTHGAAADHLAELQREHRFADSRSVLQMASLAVDASVRDLLGPLTWGARVVLPAAGTERDPRIFVEVLRRQPACDVLSLVPSMLRALYADIGDGAPPLTRAVGTVLLSGESLHAADVEAARALFGDDTAIVNQYGPTEATMTATFHRLPADTAEQPIPVGRLRAGVRLVLLDRHREPVPRGVAGEVYLGGTGLARGYLRQPGATAAAFLPDSLSAVPGERSYRTGDLALQRLDGVVVFLGRRDRQVKVRGYRVELGEIEAYLSRHPAVAEAVVAARPVAGGSPALAAYVVLRSAKTTTASELRRWLLERLPEHTVPSTFTFLDALPRTANGKVDPRALPEPRPETERAAADAALSPRGEILAGIWSELLGVEEIRAGDSFFALGGHSLLAARVAARIRDAFGVTIELRTLFDVPTLSDLEREVARALTAGRPASPPIVAVPRAEAPLSFAQRRLWFLDQLDPGTPAYNIPRALDLTGELDTALLEHVLSEVVRRQSGLRVTFGERDGEPFQRVEEPRPFGLPVVDLGALPEARQERELATWTQREALRAFDLSRGPLVRALLLRRAQRRYRLVINLHHIISDDWSMGVLIREMSMLYASWRAGRPASLPELSIQPSDYAHWQQRLLRDGGFEADLEYWRRRLGDDPPPLELPWKEDVPAQHGWRGERLGVSFGEELCERLRRLGRREGVTLFMTLLAVYQALLSHVARRRDILVGTDVANRQRVEVEPLVGFFANLLVLRSDLGGNPTFRELLRRVREVTLEAYAHQELPFDKLVEELAPSRPPGRTPLVQVLLVLQNAHRERLELPGLVIEPLDIDNRSSKFDLLLVLSETPRGLAGTWSYRTDLLARTTVEALARSFERLLERVVEDPEQSLGRLLRDLPCDPPATKESKTDMPTASKKDFGSFLSAQPKAVSIRRESLVQMRPLTEGVPMPLVLEPTGPNLDLVEWASSNRELLDEKLSHHGALLLRGFQVDAPEDVERFAAAVCDELYSEYGDLPREAVTGKIYGTTPYPPDQPILYHNESSQMHIFPLKQIFCCFVPALAGGATPLADCRQVYEKLDPEIRGRFEEKGVLYARNYTDGFDLNWQQFFHTDDPSVVETFCRDAGIDFEWQGTNVLRTRKRCPAVGRHPHTGDKVFFNQIQAHHISCVAPEVRESLISLFGIENLPRNVYYGDGTPITDEEMAHVREVYEQLAVRFSWRRGDVVLVDNMLTAHGRDPYSGPRSIVVAMGDMVSVEDI